MRDFHHLSVLQDAVVALLAPRPGAYFVDGTLGGGGHAELLLEAGVTLLGVDRDPAALAAASARLARFGARFTAVHAPFSRIPSLVDRPVDGILLDIGVSSPQLDNPERGFSFQHDGPLDLRMDPTSGDPASVWLDRLGEAELADILYQNAEERLSRRISRAILAARPILRTRQLAEVVASVVPPSGRIHPATRTFQALRILVNDELGELDRALTTFPGLLSPGGRFAVISFHSLEDRPVKECFRALAGVGASTDLYGNPLVTPSFRLVERKARLGETDPNPRARSARLRAIEKIP